MNIWDCLIIALVALMLYLAVRALRRGKTGSCHTASCDGHCEACARRMQAEK